MATSGVFRILKGGGANHGERGSASLYGGLGALPPAGSRGRAPGQGAKPPEAESFLRIRQQILLGFLHLHCSVLKTTSYTKA
jgi:hypothetical protein